MATRNLDLIREWLRNGKIIYESQEGIVVIEGSSEFLILYKGTLVHLMSDRIAVKTHQKWHVTSAPHFRGAALKAALEILERLPSNISMYIATRLPLPLVARG